MLPDAVTVADCGDVIVVRLGPIAADRMKTESQDGDKLMGSLLSPAEIIFAYLIRQQWKWRYHLRPPVRARVRNSEASPIARTTALSCQ